MNTAALVEWQRVDPENGLVEPWWTWPFMDVLKTWNLSNVNWLEFGSGRSTAWLRNKCRMVVSIESNREWAQQAMKDCTERQLSNGRVCYADLPDGIQERKQEYFDLIPTWEGFKTEESKPLVYDIISVDGIWRNECLQWAIDHFKGRGGIIIADNFDQDYVWISPAAVELMAPYEMHTYYQPDHTNHEGKPWNTRWWRIPA